MKRLVLFDLDGTLISTQGAGLRAMARAGSELWGDGFNFDGVKFGGALDPHLFAAAAERCGVEICDANHALFRDAYCRYLPDELRNSSDVCVLPGVHELLAKMTEHPHVTVGLLTGNYCHTGPLKLAAAKIALDHFEIAAFGDEAATRPDLVPLAVDRFEAMHGRRLGGREVIVVGDTPRDVDAARAHGCLAIGVATGPYDVATLEAAGAHLVLHDLSDDQPVWDLLAL